MISVVIGANNVYPEIAMSVGVDKTENFDFGTLELKNTTKEDLYVFGDSVRITIGSKIFRRIVESDQRTEVALGIYDHLITLTEHTAKLTKNIYADRFFTLKSDTTEYTLLEMADIIRLTEPFNKPPIFTIASGTETALGRDGKQIKMQTSNTFQKLTKIFKNIKAVPRLNYLDELSHVYYNEKGSPITLSSVLGNNKNIAANDYGNSIVTKARNIAFDSGRFAQDVVVFPGEGYGVTARCSEGNYSDEKAEWQLPISFREIKTVKILNVDTLNVGTVVADITDWVVDKERWDGLPVGRNTGTITGQAQRNTLYITKGDTKVLNAGVPYDSLIGTSTAFQSMLDSWFLVNLPTENPSNQSIRDSEIYFEYLPYVDADITRERYDSDVTKHAEILSQQRETVLDFKRYAGVLNDTAKRKSNGNWIITVIHTSIDDIFDTGDYTSDNYQVIKANYIVWSETQIEGTYEFAKNWSTLDGQQSTNREPQPYTMARESMDAKFRITEYIEFSKDNALDTGHLEEQGFKTLLNLFDYDANDNIPARIAQYSSADSTVGATGAINVSSFAKSVDGGMNIFFEFNERILAGNQLDITNNDELVPVNYTDDGGGVDLFSVQYVNSTTITSNNHPVGALELTPLIKLEDIPVYKDPNEIMKVNYELLWASDEPDIIIIGEQFNVYNFLSHGLTKQDTNLAIYTIDPNVAIDDMTEIIPSYLTKTVNNAGQIFVNKSGVNPYIDVSAITDTDTKTWAIGFAVDDSLVMAVNYDGVSRTRIYFNNVLEKSNINQL